MSELRIALESIGSATDQASLVAVPVFSGDDRGAAFALANEQTNGRLMRLADEEGFKAKPGQTMLIHGIEGAGRARTLLVGLGKESSFEPKALRNLSALAVREANSRKLKDAMVSLGVAASPEAIRFLVEGAVLGNYRYDAYMTQNKEALTCESVTLVADGDLAELEPVLVKARAAAEGVCLARELVNGPPIEVTPSHLAKVAAQIAEEEGLECTIFDKAEITARGMNLLLAVSAGSVEEPRFIHLTYRPPGATEDTPSVAFVGKGLTFDAGGYNIKPTGAIEEMKLDMAGSAAVLGAMKAVSAWKPNYVVHGIVPSSENLVSAAAYKPGDIIRSLNGKTVEIMNTDAEGRLILADALCYTERLGVDRIVDLATLTGACLVALGPHTVGVFANDDDFGDKVMAAADAAGEDMWRLPLHKKLRSMLDSPNADLKNVGERAGGAITAALFLSEFVGDVTWAHMDIAGPSFSSKSKGFLTKGGTGVGVLTLLELLTGEV